MSHNTSLDNSHDVDTDSEDESFEYEYVPFNPLGQGLEDEYEDTIFRIEKVQQILHVVGLTSAANVLTHPLESLQLAQKNSERMGDNDNITMVDAFLYVDDTRA